MKINFRIGLILLIVIFLASNFLVSWVLPAEASAPPTAENRGEQPVIEQAAAETGAPHIVNIPAAQIIVGLFYLLFGALTFIPLFGADARSGVLKDEQSYSIDQH